MKNEAMKKMPNVYDHEYKLCGRMGPFGILHSALGPDGRID